jgi:hypothetical protein
LSIIFDGSNLSLIFNASNPHSFAAAVKSRESKAPIDIAIDGSGKNSPESPRRQFPKQKRRFQDWDLHLYRRSQDQRFPSARSAKPV